MRELAIISSRIFIKLSDISGVGDTYLSLIYKTMDMQNSLRANIYYPLFILF